MLSWLKQTFNHWFTHPAAASAAAGASRAPESAPAIIPRHAHNVSRSSISPNALKVLNRLRSGGFEAYLVGGGVRDLLLGREPKDFDIATDATPEEVKQLFRNCRLIGRRFRLAHVHFGREIIEVATFRTHHENGDGDGEGEMQEGRILRDNVYGTIEDDAWRRDFTINALYYNIRDFSLVDYAGGVSDLEAGRLRVIGDPRERFREDAVRMLRAVRFAAKLGFRIDSETEAALFELGHLLEEMPPARLFDEVLKLFQGGYAVQTFELLRHYRLFGYLFPETDNSLQVEEGGFPQVFVARALTNTDVRVEAGKPITPAFLFAALLWEPMRREAELFQRKGVNELEAIQLAGDAVVSRQIQRVAFPKRFTLQAREVWTLQSRLKRRSGKRAERLFTHPRFRAAYDLLLLRGECGDDQARELADWWTRYQAADAAEQAAMAQSVRTTDGSGRGRRRRRSGRGGKGKSRSGPGGRGSHEV